MAGSCVIGNTEGRAGSSLHVAREVPHSIYMHPYFYVRSGGAGLQVLADNGTILRPTSPSGRAGLRRYITTDQRRR